MKFTIISLNVIMGGNGKSKIISCSFIKWSSILLNSQHIPTKKLITKINDVMFASGFLPNKMFKIYDVLGDIECRVMDVESDKHKVKIISEIFKKSKKRFRKISQQNKEE